jgi:hypothetical protein
MVAMTQQGAGPEATLEAARQVLHNRMLHHRQQSSDVITSTSSLSLLSTRCLTEGGGG